jgi:hypothetical protein
MTAAQIKGHSIDERVSIIERTATAKGLIKAETKTLEDQFAVQIERYGLPEPVREYQFEDTPVAWRWDFAWPQYKLLVEINGGIYQDPPTGHRSISGLLRDYAKLNAATQRHWWSMSFDNKAVESGEAVLMVQDFILAYAEMCKK